MGKNMLVVSLECSTRRDTIVKVCEAFESLKLKIITCSITVFPGRLLKTLFLEVMNIVQTFYFSEQLIFLIDFGY